VEYRRNNDGRISNFSFGKSHQARFGESRSDNSFGSGQSICVKRISGIIEKKLFPSGKGNCYDNAQAESFFSKFKAESEAFSYIEGYYSQVRIHSSLGDKSPMEFEAELKTKNNGGNRIFL
jgi:hypothetical protein